MTNTALQFEITTIEEHTQEADGNWTVEEVGVWVVFPDGFKKLFANAEKAGLAMSAFKENGRHEDVEEVQPETLGI